MKVKGIFLAAILAAVTCVSGNVFAVLSGDGSEANPYLIQSRADFDEFAGNSVYWAANVHTKLICNLDLAGTTYTQAVIATVTEFNGKFDGNGHTIRNLTITAPTKDLIGLFDRVGSGGQICNLGVVEANISGNEYVGGLAGEVLFGTLISCYVTGSVSGTENCVGGLVGRNYLSQLSSCNANCSVSGKDSVGGLVGWNRGGTIENCSSINLVNGTGDFVGGLVGQNYDDLSGYGYGTLTSSYAMGSVIGSGYVGGLVGINWGTIKRSYSSCITKGGGGAYVSGIGGLVGFNRGIVNHCHSSGNVIGNYYVGGLVGRNFTGPLTSCYSTGWISGSYYVGGLVGDNGTTGTITSCFWDTQSSGQATSSGGTGKTTDQMKTLSTFTSAGWDFTNETAKGTKDIWRMCMDGMDYPRLSWDRGSNGDFTCPDGVGVDDLQVLGMVWLSAEGQAGYSYACDTNSDSKTNMADFTILANHWLSTYLFTDYTLSVSVLGGNGTVSPSSGIYREGTVCGLIAIPGSAYKVKAWYGTDNDSSGSTINTVTMNSDKTVAVEFESKPYYQLTTSVIGGNGAISPSSQQYVEGTVVTLTATPSFSYRVKEWHGTNNDSSKSTTNTVTMNSSKNVTVEFEVEFTGLLPNGGFEMGDFTYWNADEGAFIETALTEGNYAALLWGGFLSRMVNLPSYGNYTISFDYSCDSGYAYMNGQQLPLIADSQIHTVIQNLQNISSITIEFSSYEGTFVVDNCVVENCLDCGSVCGDGICDGDEMGWCPDCPPIDPPMN